MVRIERSILINVSSEKVWSMVFWDRVPEWMDQVKTVKYVSEYKDRIGATAHLSGQVGSIKAEFDAETTEWVENERFAWRTSSGTFTGFGWIALTPINSVTKATFVMDYDLPYSFLGVPIDRLRVVRDLERGTDRALEKLKRLVEEKNCEGGDEFDKN